MRKAFHVIEPGLHTTIQDIGRYHYQQFGVAPSGAMDEDALQMGNLLLGNKQSAAGLEITMVGPSLKAESDLMICITGADLNPTIDHEPVGTWCKMFMREGQTLRFGKPAEGARAYLTVAGGFSVKKVMGSSSTYTAGKFGGYEGRTLKSGDSLICNSSQFSYNKKRRIHSARLSHSMIPTYKSHQLVRVIPGPQAHMFTEDAIHTFYSASYKVSPNSNRMGYRLEGSSLAHIGEHEIVTDAVAKGSIQVPGNGQPIVLMADRQTTGGYPKIANVISADLWKIAQLLPGHTVSFQKTSVGQAHEALRIRAEQQRQIQLLHGK
ncbi:5-oxoprolinase subunit C family protein [Evansella halocellulosilytica]|uniref:5-oxoprolinase subunit C family protein n=1 Tax=Evansella halocellulosilytica TaxID=2011013 RepID=UPI000BB6D49F|nr:biotin-dependent carboxyltransferase family protein [Evansella halocellulosilytica]